ncbi:MAG: hypothetical protein FWC28_03430 [Proteobacteria bacterium]|nr:hypothetical protein [Cystobacterineae bacterium]MCL2259294.1 hypothetical protein [Cystobacterineae bacterium]MCL2314291.1 hypothetical protein [Pseudomonadota bacterium]
MRLDGDNFHIDIWHDINNANDIEFHVHCGGKKYFGWAFTLTGIEALMRKDRLTGESSRGTYFWVVGLIVVESISKEILVQAISDLVKSNGNSLESIFPIVDV